MVKSVNFCCGTQNDNHESEVMSSNDLVEVLPPYIEMM